MLKVILAGLIGLIPFSSDAQTGNEFGLKINEGKGTMVIRKIQKNQSAPNKSAKIIARIFRPFDRQVQAGPIPFKILFIDSSGYSLNTEGNFNIELNPGKHKISIVYQPDVENSYNSFKATWMKFRKNRTYFIDFYVWPPYTPDHH